MPTIESWNNNVVVIRVRVSRYFFLFDISQVLVSTLPGLYAAVNRRLCTFLTLIIRLLDLKEKVDKVRILCWWVLHKVLSALSFWGSSCQQWNGVFDTHWPSCKLRKSRKSIGIAFKLFRAIKDSPCLI